MTCTTAHRLVQEACESGTPFDAPLQAHLGQCGSCQQYAERMQLTAPIVACKARVWQLPSWTPLLLVGMAVLIVMAFGRSKGAPVDLSLLLQHWLQQARSLLHL